MNQFQYIDSQGNFIGPVSLEGLRQLRLEGKLGDQTQVLNEATKRFTTLGQLLSNGEGVLFPVPPPERIAGQTSTPAIAPSPTAPLENPSRTTAQLTTNEKLLLDRVAKRSATRDRMIANQKVRTIVCAIIVGLGLLALIGTLAGGKEGVRNSLADQLKSSNDARDAGLAGDDSAARMVADVTRLTDYEYKNNIGMSAGLMLFGGLVWLRWKLLWEGWPFIRAKAWTGAVFFFFGFLMLVTEMCGGDTGGIVGDVIICGIGIWLFRSGISKTKAIIAHLSAPTLPQNPQSL
jgi:hypothetical protein